MNYTATIQFSASDALEAQRAMQFMRETFCNDDSIHEVTASLIDANFTQWLMVRNGVEQPLNPKVACCNGSRFHSSDCPTVR